MIRALAAVSKGRLGLNPRVFYGGFLYDHFKGPPVRDGTMDTRKAQPCCAKRNTMILNFSCMEEG